MAMTDLAALALVHSDGLFVSAGEQPMPKSYKSKRVIFWVAARRAIGEPRGFGNTLAEAVSDMLSKHAELARESDDDLL